MKHSHIRLNGGFGKLGRLHNQHGATAVIIAIVLPLLFAVGALALDVTRLYYTRKELQNAADACALAAASKLYNDAGTAIQVTANGVGFLAAKRNPSETASVELWHGGSNFTGMTWPTDNAGDIRRGHWHFSDYEGISERFTPNDSTVVLDLWDYTTAELDDPTTCLSNPSANCFINAVQCVTRRETSPVINFFAPLFSLFGGTAFLNTIVHAEAVAVRQFAGTLMPWEADAPIVICRDSILEDDEGLTCTYGRMMPGNDDTAMWTNFSQDTTPYSGESTCGESTNASTQPFVENDPNTDSDDDIPGLRWIIEHDGVCQYNGVNPNEIRLGYGASTVGGELASVHDVLRSCWLNATVDHDNDSTTTNVSIDSDGDDKPDYPWKITLPVAECNNPGCNNITGAVNLELLWITVNGSDSQYDEIPEKMWDEKSDPPGFWTCTSTSTNPTARRAERIACVNSFFQRFNLHDADGNEAYENPDDNTDRDWLSTSLYFRPDCDELDTAGKSGGENYGILAKYPALVR